MSSIPKYEAEIDRLMQKHGMGDRIYDSLLSKMARVIITLDRKVTDLELRDADK